jgi:hypothetical protein
MQSKRPDLPIFDRSSCGFRISVFLRELAKARRSMILEEDRIKCVDAQKRTCGLWTFAVPAMCFLITTDAP